MRTGSEALPRVAVPRFLLLTKTHLVVLAEDGGGRLVKSMHKLTDIERMTFKKKNTKLISLYYPQRNHGAASDPPKQEEQSNGTQKVVTYELDQRDQFVELLRQMMK